MKISSRSISTAVFLFLIASITLLAAVTGCFSVWIVDQLSPRMVFHLIVWISVSQLAAAGYVPLVKAWWTDMKDKRADR